MRLKSLAAKQNEWIDNRCDYGEERIVALGRTERKIVYVVYTWRGDAEANHISKEGNKR